MILRNQKETSFFVTNEDVIFASDSTCFINLYINYNYSQSFLIDTGASISAIEYKQVSQFNIPIHKEQLTINGIGGSIEAIGYVYLTLTDGITSESADHVFRHKFYVFNTLPCQTRAILGHDFLQQHNAVLNLELNSLTLCDNSGNKVTTTLRSKNEWKNKTYILPPRSESIHFVKTNFSEEGLVCATELREGIFLASTLVKPTNGLIPILVLNTNENEVCLDNITPDICKISEYNLCSFDKCENLNADRVKKLFNLLQLKHLNNEEQVAIENICAKFSDVFLLPGDKLTTTNIYSHHISLKPNVNPVYTKPYRMPYSQKTEINNQISDMLKEGIIEPCQSEWSSPILLVPKKLDKSGTKKWRLVIDYRKLNNSIQDDKFPLPNIVEILDSLAGSVYYSSLDLSSGYYQCNLDLESRKYTAFSSGQYRVIENDSKCTASNSGQFQMTRMPMGLKTSPNSFAKMMTIAMSGLSYEKCLIYLDDLIVFGKSLEHHNKNLIEVLSRLRQVNLKLNPLKCDFLKKEILYLGHVISGEGILPDPKKIEALTNWPVPKNVEEVIRFVAFANYYRKFINNFAYHAYHLTRLTKKNTPFIWTESCQQAFENLKLIIAKPPVLHYPDLSENSRFILQTDASNHSLGAVLCNQNKQPIAFASRNLNKSEMNYPTIEKELLAIVWAVKHFRPYLYGRTFIIQTDHKPLIHLFGMRDPSSRLLKFRLVLEEYDFMIEYIKGMENVPADAMSRLRITSHELKEMNESVINVMTRSQYRKIIQDRNSGSAIVSTDDRPAQPKVVEIHSKPRTSIEFSFIAENSLDKLRNDKEIEVENNVFCFARRKMTLFINPVAQSQLTPAAFVRELSCFCKKINVHELCFIRNKKYDYFVEKLINEIKKEINWSGPRLCILNNVRRIEDKDDRKVILNDFHLLPTSGHAGIRRMYNNIKKYYFWPGLENDVTEFIRKCDKCQKHKHSSHPTKEPMSITTTANSAMEKVFLDVVGPIDRDDNNYSYILTIQCELSKYVEAYPMTSKSSVEIAKNFVNNFILRYGIPERIATDRGAEFLSNVFKEVCKLLNITMLQSTAYHHQTIGALENTHKSLGNYLRIQTDNYPGAWSDWLPYWCFSYNTTVHTATKYTPFELVFGRKCNIPSNLIKDRVEPLYNCDDYPQELRYRIQTSQKEARQNLIDSKLRRKTDYDENCNSVTYKENDLILIKNETGNKLKSIYNGPYLVVKDVAPNVEIIKDGKIDLVHKNRTKLYYPT